jgi:DNA repair exonuclease SbcCD nuclease subunit
MPRLSFIYRTDTHACDRSPSSWKADYPSEIWSNLEQVGRFAKEHDVNAVLDGGDFFHVKAASRNTHGLIVRTASLHEAYPCRTFCVEGNHDMAYNSLESLSKQPLGVLYATGVFQHLRDSVFEDGSLRVRVVGVPYSPNRTLAELRSIQKKPGDTFLVAVVHQLAAENPPPSVEDFFGEPVFRYADLVSEDGPDVFLFGHWHKDQGIVVIAGKHFVNQGAVSRGALSNENVTRTPKVALIEADPSGIRVTPIPLLVAPAEDVFDMDRKERAEQENKSIDQFLLRLQQDAQIDPMVSIETNIASLDFVQDVRDTALEYLERARANARAEVG